jgi:hypothetical protein
LSGDEGILSRKDCIHVLKGDINVEEVILYVWGVILKA